MELLRAVTAHHHCTIDLIYLFCVSFAVARYDIRYPFSKVFAIEFCC